MSKRDFVIGLLEDDPDQAELVGLWLEQAGYTHRVFRTANEFRRRRRALGVEKRPGAGNNLAAAAGWFRAAHPLESHA